MKLTFSERSSTRDRFSSPRKAETVCVKLQGQLETPVMDLLNYDYVLILIFVTMVTDTTSILEIIIIIDSHLEHYY